MPSINDEVTKIFPVMKDVEDGFGGLGIFQLGELQ